MRTRLLLVAALSAAFALPAHAGQDSTRCNDGNIGPTSGGGQEIALVNPYVTLGIEVGSAPTSTSTQYVQVCFSDTPAGQPSGVTGGTVQVGVDSNTGTVTPGTAVHLYCWPDGGFVALPSCFSVAGVTATPGDVSAPRSTFCLVYLDGCVAYLPGKVSTNSDPRPLLTITVLGVSEPVDLPALCVAVVVSCP